MEGGNPTFLCIRWIFWKDRSGRPLVVGNLLWLRFALNNSIANVRVRFIYTRPYIYLYIERAWIEREKEKLGIRYSAKIFQLPFDVMWRDDNESLWRLARYVI